MVFSQLDVAPGIRNRVIPFLSQLFHLVWRLGKWNSSPSLAFSRPCVARTVSVSLSRSICWDVRRSLRHDTKAASIPLGTSLIVRFLFHILLSQHPGMWCSHFHT
jgi:hypothetical protein